MLFKAKLDIEAENPSLLQANKVCAATQPFSVAPMMQWTDRHYRYFARLISPHAGLYTEMVSTGALIHGDRARFLAFDESEQPLALQLGGSDPKELAQCAKMAADWGYDEVNLNCGCPSDRVQNARIGACLMEEPEHVAKIVAAMDAATALPVTVKCRVGVDDQAEVKTLPHFLETVSAAGCDTFIIHARKAWLQGLSPKENREIPPLQYELVERMKADFPHLHITLNGGIKEVQAAQEHYGIFKSLMIGREAYHNPYCLAELEAIIYGTPLPNRDDIARRMIPYMEDQLKAHDTPHKSVLKHMLGLYHGQRGGRLWRQSLSNDMPKAAPFGPLSAQEIIERGISAVHGAQNSL